MSDLVIDFLIVDETVNRYGYRILVDGINIDGFLKNPVCCVQHNTYDVSVGRWISLRKENGKLLGTLEFDADDDTAKKLYNKYKKGYMNAVSLSIIPTEESEDPKYLLPGQTLPTVTKSELLEISLVTIPGLKNAVKLVKPDGGEYKLSLITNNQTMENNKTVEQLQQELNELRKLNADNLVKLHQQRGVVQEEEKEAMISLALTDYKAVARLLEARKVEKGAVTDVAKQLVALHTQRLALTPEEIAFYEKTASMDYEGTKKILEMRKGIETINAFVSNLEINANNQEDRSKWSYLDWYRIDLNGLQTMAKNDPARFKRLEAEFLNESARVGIITTQHE